ncbi:MAG TPA: response regulator transcription factor [Bacteroidia bacterium]|jgi:DNA-binding NarL/FixJ family response regulator|nr:response regulator transcription factor [Bacteroidia bacterium]
MEQIKIVVAGDNYLFSKGMECLIEESPLFDLAGTVLNEIELIDKLSNKQADVLAIDISSIGWSEDMLKRVMKYAPELKILAFNTVKQRNEVSVVLGNGVTSYLLLCCDKAEITEALLKTAKGERFLCGKVLNVLINIPQREANGHDAGCPLYSVCAGVNISEREMEIIRYVSGGLSNQEIAGKLFLSVHTVNTHRKNIMSKLGINNTAGLVMYAVRNQLVN